MSECIPNDYWLYILAMAYMILEAWLGKTEKVKAGSILELIIISTLSVVVFLIYNRKEKNERH